MALRKRWRGRLLSGAAAGMPAELTAAERLTLVLDAPALGPAAAICLRRRLST